MVGDVTSDGMDVGGGWGRGRRGRGRQWLHRHVCDDTLDVDTEPSEERLKTWL